MLDLTQFIAHSTVQTAPHDGQIKNLRKEVSLRAQTITLLDLTRDVTNCSATLYCIIVLCVLEQAHTRARTYTRAHLRMCTCALSRARTHTHTHSHIHIHMHTHAHTYIHTYIRARHTHAQRERTMPNFYVLSHVNDQYDYIQMPRSAVKKLSCVNTIIAFR